MQSELSGTGECLTETNVFLPAIEMPLLSNPEDAEVIELEIADVEDDPENGRGSLAGTVASVILHVWLLMNLAQMTIEQQPYYYEPPIDSQMVENQSEEEEIEVVDYELADPNDRDHEVREVVNAASVGMAQTDTPRVESQPRPVTELIPDASQRSRYDIPEGVEVDERVMVKGTTGEAMVQLESALDRVTWEIAKNLQESRVLVVWMLDASGSLDKQKQVIARRLRRVYGELDALQQTDQIPRHKKPLLSGVVTFGNRTNFITPNPTEKFEEIHNGIMNAEADQTGVENVFTAVQQVSRQWSRFRTQQFRRTMLIVVTDEAGDDFETALEPSIKLCQRYGTKAYVIGPSAVFGRRKGFVPYVAPENGQEYRLPIDLGPESAVIEMVDLPFWYDGPDLTYLSAGFAPYALARLVHETGGVYFMTSMTTMSGLTPVGVFDNASLKPFAPDYSFNSAEAYQQDLLQHPIRMAVANAAFASRQYQPGGTPQLSFAVTPQNFKTVAAEAQKTAAQSQLSIDMIGQAFMGSIETELDREPSARWRANFCLAYG
ncbi:MAG: vWA domain-containing protein, partial [Planctomycetaceae bacterium]